MKVDTGRQHRGAQGIRCKEAPIVNERRPGQIESAGHMAGPQSGPRLRGRAAEAVRRPGVHHLRQTTLQSPPDGVRVSHQSRLERCFERAVRRLAPAGREGIAFSDPPRQSPVKDEDIAMAHGAERPPNSGSREQTLSIVDDNATV